MSAPSDQWPQSRPDLMREIVRRNDARGGGGATTARLASEKSRRYALLDLASDTIRIERVQAERQRMMTAIRRSERGNVPDERRCRWCGDIYIHRPNVTRHVYCSARCRRNADTYGDDA